ncbi:MAG: hypothetical protein GXP27_07445 [Planctomycetes bacterium]|nr:hypothetical protein [Planctomycetota bacterium]
MSTKPGGADHIRKEQRVQPKLLSPDQLCPIPQEVRAVTTSSRLALPKWYSAIRDLLGRSLQGHTQQQPCRIRVQSADRLQQNRRDHKEFQRGWLIFSRGTAIEERSHLTSESLDSNATCVVTSFPLAALPRAVNRGTSSTGSTDQMAACP